MILPMFDKAFAKWWLDRVVPFKDVTTEKLDAETLSGISLHRSHCGSSETFWPITASDIGYGE